MKKSLLVLAHGSKVEETKKVMYKVKDNLVHRRKYDDVQIAFLQFNEPNISDTVAKIYEQGIREIIVVPMFLFNGNHILIDIPEELSKLKDKYKDLKISLADSIGFDERIVDILEERVEGRLCEI